MIFCLLCHSRNITLFLTLTENIPWELYGIDKNNHPDNLKYFQCNTCKLIFKDPAIRAKVENEKQHYLKHNNQTENEEYQNYMLKLIEPLKKYIKKGDEGLDFGAGYSAVMEQMFRKLGYTCFSFDPIFCFDEKLLDREYDFITCSEAAEHFCDPFQEFQVIFKLLKPEGHLAIRTKFGPKENFKDWWYHRDPTHVVFYSDETFLYIANKFHRKISFLENDISIFYK